MMDGTKFTFQSISAAVDFPSTHGLTPAGVTPIEHTSCKAKKRPRTESFPLSSSSYNPGPSSSRVTKANNKSKGSGPKSSLSSLARPSLGKRQNTATDAAAVTSITAAAAISATADELGAIRYHPPETKWDHFNPPSLHSNGEESVAPDTNPGTRDHFTLSSAFTQNPGVVYDGWSGDNLDPLTSNGLLPMFHAQPSYLATHENVPQRPPPINYSTDYPGSTTDTFALYSLPVSLDQNMTVKYGPYPGEDGTSIQGQPTQPGSSYTARPESGIDDTQNSEWVVDMSGSGEDSNPSNYDFGQIPVLSGPLSGGEALGLEKDSWEDLDPPVIDNVATEENRSLSQSEKRSRSCLSSENRAKTGKTRKMKKIRCDPDLENPGVDCLTCRKINLESKKVIHRLPCLRWKLGEIVMFREGGLDLTKRWTGTKMKDLGPRDWDRPNDRVRSIRVTIGCKKQPLELEVRKFVPTEGDVTGKSWVDARGMQKIFDIQPYALASIWETAKRYRKYVFCNARLAIEEYTNNSEVDTLVRKTYDAALEYAMELEQHPMQTKGDEVIPYIFLNQYFNLWFAIRNTLGSAFIVGEDKLDMEPIQDRECPYYGKVFVSRMIPAQFDSLGYERILTPLRKQVLEGLWKMMASKNPHHFFTIYLTVFMMLHEVSFTSADRLRRAKENYKSERYDLQKFTERLQEGANIILSHWHYYKRDVNTLMMDIESEDKKNAVWAELDSGQVQLLSETRQAYKDRENQCLEPMDWEHGLFFVSQMFEDGWEPKKTYSS